MKLLSSLLVFVAIVSTAYTLYKYTDDMEDNPRYCFSSHPAIGYMKKFEVKQLKNCRQALCSEDHIVQYSQCLRWSLSPCKIIPPKNISNPYPECCPEIVC